MDIAPASVSPRWHDRDGPVVCLLCAWTLLVFGLVWSPWWMPSGDAEVFVVTARNLFHGRGYTFNGLPIAFIPPGWPVVLAGLYHLTDQYLWLKAFQIACMMVFLLASYAVLRRFTSPRTAGLACGLSAILWPLYPLTMWLHSDALFCAVAGMTAAICVYWADGRLGWWWLALIVLGCVACVIVRWAALPQAIVLAALACGSRAVAASRSRRWPHLAPRHWIGISAVVLATFGTFAAIKSALRHDERTTQQLSEGLARLSARETPTQFQLPLAMIEVPEEVLAPDLFIGRQNPDVTPVQELARRALNIPKWFSWTLFSPMRVADSLYAGPVSAGLLFDYSIGLLAMAMLALAAWRAAPRGPSASRGHYLWLGVLVYVIALGLNWPHVNNRYLVPIAPFLIAGILAGLGELAHLRLARALRWSFIAAVLAINGALWCVDVAICRSTSAESFYARWEAGIYPSLIEIGTYLDQQPGISDGQIVASERYQNLNERWEYPLSPRSLVMMTDRSVRPVPPSMTGWGVRKAQAWARQTGAAYYVQQNPTMPGRVWHFRVTPELEERITGWPPARERPQFELFTMQPDPIPKNPELQSLKYQPVPVLLGEDLERATRRIPHVRQ